MHPNARRSELDRFLINNRGNIQEAAIRFERFQKWRSERSTSSAPTKETIAVLQNRIIYHLPGLAVDGSSLLVFHGCNHNPSKFSASQITGAIIFSVAEILASRDLDDPRITVYILVLFIHFSSIATRIQMLNSGTILCTRGNTLRRSGFRSSC